MAAKACIALANLVMDSAHEAVCVQHGAIDLACRAMRAHVRSVAVQTDAASLLCNLAFTSRFTAAIIERGAVRLVMQAMQAFPELAFLMEESCGCLRNLAGGSTANAVSVFEAGALPLVLRALDDHGDNLKLVEEALHCIRNVATAEPVRARALTELPCIARLVAAARRHLHVSDLALLAIGSLMWICAPPNTPPELLQLAGSQGAVDAALEVAARHLPALCPPDASIAHALQRMQMQQQLHVCVAKPILLSNQSFHIIIFTTLPSLLPNVPLTIVRSQPNEPVPPPEVHPSLECVMSACKTLVALVLPPACAANRRRLLRDRHGLARLLDLVQRGYSNHDTQFVVHGVCVALVDVFSCSCLLCLIAWRCCVWPSIIE